MKILKAIGGVFVKIWRWIKNTAWVQPLLIVGAIFGVIFSIPAITSGIQGLVSGANSADSFYHNYQKSMEGNKNSAADTLFKNYEDYYDDYTSEEHEEGYLPTVPDNENKFFLMFTSSNNAAAKDIKSGFEVLKNNWGSTFAPKNSKESFRLYTIYTNEKTSSTTPYVTAFSQFLGRQYTFFEQASVVGLNSNYYLNGKITEDDLNNLAMPEPDSFKVPTIMLIDWRKYDGKDEDEKSIYEDEPNKKAGISQIMFDVEGSTPYERANLLYQCWNNEGDFGPKH